jgi:hypothetical protein
MVQEVNTNKNEMRRYEIIKDGRREQNLQNLNQLVEDVVGAKGLMMRGLKKEAACRVVAKGLILLIANKNQDWEPQSKNREQKVSCWLIDKK